jgi:LAO/AO transport system kinase
LVSALRAAGKKVAVLAVDPSSPFTGGAILGDRIRMSRHATDDGVYIRSLATRGALGGLSRAAFDSTRVLDAAGFDVILLETVGTGQSEVEVAAAADTTVVLEAPEMGDEVQAIKAGLLEVADIVVVNKGDRPGAQRTAGELRAMLTAAPSPRHARASDGAAAAPSAAERPHPNRPEVLVTTATTGEGAPGGIGRRGRGDRRAPGPGGRARLGAARRPRAGAPPGAGARSGHDRHARRGRSPRAGPVRRGRPAPRRARGGRAEGMTSASLPR